MFMPANWASHQRLIPATRQGLTRQPWLLERLHVDSDTVRIRAVEIIHRTEIAEQKSDGTQGNVIGRYNHTFIFIPRGETQDLQRLPALGNREHTATGIIDTTWGGGLPAFALRGFGGDVDLNILRLRIHGPAIMHHRASRNSRSQSNRDG